TRSACATLGALIVLAGCAPATSTAESRDRGECKEYARTFEHSGRMKDACLISRGYTVSYSTNGGGVDVAARAQPRPAAEVVATDLKACNDQSGLGYEGRLQFTRCMTPRGYTVRSGD
ncbi:MAG TPA: hypothetical protein VFZ82_05365, partial [Methylomirabilota bacterium]|nr:hypothetical protein [Methylomirabilota bacterium]